MQARPHIECMQRRPASRTRRCRHGGDVRGCTTNRRARAVECSAHRRERRVLVRRWHLTFLHHHVVGRVEARPHRSGLGRDWAAARRACRVLASCRALASSCTNALPTATTALGATTKSCAPIAVTPASWCRGHHRTPRCGRSRRCLTHAGAAGGAGLAPARRHLTLTLQTGCT